MVCPECYSEEAEDKSHEAASDNGGQKRYEDAQRRVRIGAEMLVEIAAYDARDAAHIHDARDSKVQVAALLGEDLAGGAEEERDALSD